ncbi:mitochondrial import receptor subunit TOM20-like protein, partial [Tanacetum coccineum]
TNESRNLEEASFINPAKHEALWCLGKAHTVNAFIISNHVEAKILFDEAFHCIQNAADESPKNEEYLQYLAECAKVMFLARVVGYQNQISRLYPKTQGI